MTTKRFFLILIFSSSIKLFAQPYQTAHQNNWHEMEYYNFICFGLNTFTDAEWGTGKEPLSVFSLIDINVEQWIKTLQLSGSKGVILVAKHHDGFCLWPSKFSNYTIRETNFKNGKGDIVKEVVDNCKKYGLKFGFYLSPWDRNHPDYGTEKYNEIYVGMMKELLSYGQPFEFWFDGANGEGPNGKKQVYDFKRYIKCLRENAPGTVIFSDIGPDARWVGNEKGFAGTTNYNTLNTDGFGIGAASPKTDTLNIGNKFGKYWIPSESDVSIRPGWYWHAKEDDKVRSPESLFNLYLKSVGRGSTLLLNVPPNNQGVIGKIDSVNLIGFKQLMNEAFKINLINSQKSTSKLTDKNTSTFVCLKPNNILVLKLSESPINCIVLRENLNNGQRIDKTTITLYNRNKKIKTIDVTTVGYKRIITFPTESVTEIVVQFELYKGDKAEISEAGVYKINNELIEK